MSQIQNNNLDILLILHYYIRDLSNNSHPSNEGCWVWNMSRNQNIKQKGARLKQMAVYVSCYEERVVVGFEIYISCHEERVVVGFEVGG